MLTSILSCSKPSEEIVINHPKEVRSTPNILFVIADDLSLIARLMAILLLRLRHLII